MVCIALVLFLHGQSCVILRNIRLSYSELAGFRRWVEAIHNRLYLMRLALRAAIHLTQYQILIRGSFLQHGLRLLE